ncbi:MAG: hypothetical protein AB7L09_03110 [Nitrospira sp.]
MFQIGDRVRNRYAYDTPFVGTVVLVRDRWVHVKHDESKRSPADGDRFDYRPDELQHLNPLIRLVRGL